MTMCNDRADKPTERQASPDPTQTELDLRDEIEILREQVASLELELADKNQNLQEIEQELKDTNRDLFIMNQELQQLLLEMPLSLIEARELAKELLATGKGERECLAALLSGIYKVCIEPWELGKQQMPQFVQYSPPVRVALEKYVSERMRSQSQRENLQTNIVSFKAQVARLKNHLEPPTLKPPCQDEGTAGAEFPPRTPQ